MIRETALTFTQHLEELRKRLMIALAAVGIATTAGFFFSDALLKVLTVPLKNEMGHVYFFSPTGAFAVKLEVALLTGVLAASPVWLYQLWQFLSPALFEKEKRMVIALIGTASFLFLAGVAFAFFLVVPVSLQFLVVGMQSEVLKPMISIEHYIAFLRGMLLAFGVAFNFPVMLLALAGLGILSSGKLSRYRRHVIVLIFIAAAILTPTPDMFGQLILALPLVLLFEISIWGARGMEWMRKNRRKGLS
ncbi:MAG: twin-arginine translocase subunit TatC [Candidatus Omnitrophica bacterium]|nr:twin-arginine translocase subunit TatC [Candidatus Omnitrophota bacterium]